MVKQVRAPVQAATSKKNKHSKNKNPEQEQEEQPVVQVPVRSAAKQTKNGQVQQKGKQKGKPIVQPEYEEEIKDEDQEFDVQQQDEQDDEGSEDIDDEDNEDDGFNALREQLQQQGEEKGEPMQEEEGEEGEGEGKELEGADENMPMGEDEEAGKKPNDISLINMKIQEILSILGNFTVLGGGKNRKDYLNELKGHLQVYYGYNMELIDHFLTFLNPNELIQFFEANETQRPLTIRVNTLKTRRKQLAQALIQRGVNLDPLAQWSKVGIKIYESRVPIGATPEYLAGHYMLQSASSFLPAIALEPQVNERVLDLAAAPGGKTTYLSQLMKNTGVVVANDFKKQRLRALQFNVQRLGISNVIVTNYDGRKINKVMNNFDRVLLDAPCTGLGIISKDHSIKAEKQLIDIQKHSHLQKELILAAIDAAKPNGVIVYSTCSVSPLENEEVVNYALKRRFVKLVDLPLDVGEPGLTKYVEKRYHVDLTKTRRIYPHVHNMDGFYVAKIYKVSNGDKKVQDNEDGDFEQIDFVPEKTEEKPKKIAGVTKTIKKHDVKKVK